METGEEGLGMEQDMEGRDETRVRDWCCIATISAVPWQPFSSGTENRTSTLSTLRKPRPMGGAILLTGARNRSDPIVRSGMINGCGPLSWKQIC